MHVLSILTIFIIAIIGVALTGGRSVAAAARRVGVLCCCWPRSACYGDFIVSWQPRWPCPVHRVVDWNSTVGAARIAARRPGTYPAARRAGRSRPLDLVPVVCRKYRAHSGSKDRSIGQSRPCLRNPFLVFAIGENVMSTSTKIPASIRQDDPGASHETTKAPLDVSKPPAEPALRDQNRVSGGGERDRHHGHGPNRKGGN